MFIRHFPSVEAYNDYYDIVVDTCDIGVEDFATRAQYMLVDSLRPIYGDEVAHWCRDFWMASRRRMCLCHGRYAGCNNNMGVEVSWCDIKKLCSCLDSLGQFIGCLCQFIKSVLGEEHMYLLEAASNLNAFIRNPVATKEMWDGVQDVKPKTLRLCVIVEHFLQRSLTFLSSTVTCWRRSWNAELARPLFN
jgi:hypothetical protein